MEGARPAMPAEPGTLKATLMDLPGIDKMTEKESAHPSQRQLDKLTKAGPGAALFSTGHLPELQQQQLLQEGGGGTATGGHPTPAANSESNQQQSQQSRSSDLASALSRQPSIESGSIRTEGNAALEQQQQQQQQQQQHIKTRGEERDANARPMAAAVAPGGLQRSMSRGASEQSSYSKSAGAGGGGLAGPAESWVPTQDWVTSWKTKLPLQTIMRLLQVLVPQVEKICIDKGLTDESEILRFLQHGTLVGLLPVPHPILIRKYQPNPGTALWFRTYMWGVIYLRNTDPPIWYDTDVKLFEIQRV